MYRYRDGYRYIDIDRYRDDTEGWCVEKTETRREGGIEKHIHLINNQNPL